MKIWIDHQDGTGYKDYNLAADEIDSLVVRFNKLSKFDFKQNTELVGTMPEYGIILTCGEEWYSINQCSDSNGTLEMGYGGNMWWISDKNLYTVVSSVLAAYSENGSSSIEMPVNNEEDRSKDVFAISLAEEEIAQVNEAFNQLVDNGEGGLRVNPLSCFFTSYYTDPRSIDLTEFLAYFPSDETLTDPEEFDALKESENFPFDADISLEDMWVPVHKMQAQVIDDVLQRYADVALSELDDAGKSSSDLLYLKEYNAYYNFISDFAAGYFTCVGGKNKRTMLYCTRMIAYSLCANQVKTI